MISRTTIKRCYAWMLLITFTLMLSLRGIHYHYEKSHDCDVKTTESTACTTVKAVCNVCDFVFQKLML